METEPAETPQEPISPKRPWYSLDPRALSHSRLVRAVLIALLLSAFSIAPLWRFLWYHPFYSFRNFAAVTDSRGRKVEAWRWIESREIDLLQLPGTGREETGEAAAGINDLLHDVGLNFTVKILPPPEAVLSAYKASLEQATWQGQPTPCVNFDTLASRLAALRPKNGPAYVLIVDDPIAGTPWAQGMSVFSQGLMVLEASSVNRHLSKHETAHLMGYMMHDSFPLFVFGYPWEGWPWDRDTLMLLYGGSDQLSPRARGALRAFWQGLEKRTGETYLSKS